MDVQVVVNRPTQFWTFPIEAVSQSEGGYELVHQSVVVMPHWRITADASRSWSVRMTLDIDTKLGELRISRGTIDWVPRNHAQAYRLEWERFDEVMRENGVRS